MGKFMLERLNIKKKDVLGIITFAMLVLVAALILCFSSPQEQTTVLDSSTAAENSIIAYYSEKWIQNFPAKEKFNAIEVKLATYYQNYDHGTLCFRLLDNSTGETIVQKEMPAEKIRDNQFLHIDLGVVDLRGKSSVSLELWVEDFSGQDLALYCTDNGESLIFYLVYSVKKIVWSSFVDAVLVSGFWMLLAYLLYRAWSKKIKGYFKGGIANLFKEKTILIVALLCGAIFLVCWCFVLLTLRELGRGWYAGLFIGAFIETALVACAMKDEIAYRPEKLFATICVLVGGCLCVTLPLGAVSWDDHIHYNRALYTSHLYSKQATAAECYYLPAFIEDISDKNAVSEKKTSLNDLYQKGEVQNIAVDGLNLYSRLCYVPAAFMMAVGRLLRMPSHSLFYMGRLGMVFLYAYLVYVSVKKLKSGKLLLAIVALLPTSLFQAASYSYDPWVTGFAILGVSCVISEIQQPQKQMRVGEICVMLGAFLMLGSAKAIYFPLTGLAFFVGKTKFQTKKEYRNYCWYVIGTMFFLILSFVWPMFIKPLFVGQGLLISDMRGGSDINGKEQLLYILRHPFQYAKTLLNFLKGYLAVSSSGGFMTFFAYVGYGIKWEVLIILLGIITVTDKNDYDRNLRYSFKWITYGIAFVTVALIATSLYITFTPVGAEDIAGCQPRYLTPILYPLLAVTGSAKIENQINKVYYNLVAFAVVSYVIFQSFWYVCIIQYPK